MNVELTDDEAIDIIYALNRLSEQDGKDRNDLIHRLKYGEPEWE